MLDIHFDPPDFDPYEYPRHAWGIRGGYEVVEVKVRFSKEATYRVRESDWPGVIAREEDQDGRCTLTFLVNHVLEIKSWIRGWGPECEVLAPDELRREIAAEMKPQGRCIRLFENRAKKWYGPVLQVSVDTQAAAVGLPPPDSKTCAPTCTASTPRACAP